MPIKAIILLFIIGIMIAWFAQDEIYAWIEHNLKDKKENKKDE